MSYGLDGAVAAVHRGKKKEVKGKKKTSAHQVSEESVLLLWAEKNPGLREKKKEASPILQEWNIPKKEKGFFDHHIDCPKQPKKKRKEKGSSRVKRGLDIETNKKVREERNKGYSAICRILTSMGGGEL